MKYEDMIKRIKTCPFCGYLPHFTGDGDNWKDDGRYVEMSITCCATMTKALGWRFVKENKMQVKDIEDYLEARLIEDWNKREEPNENYTE